MHRSALKKRKEKENENPTNYKTSTGQKAKK